jgi:hypothetical protein
MNIRLITRQGDPQWERLVFAELLVPETPNVFGDYWTREGIRQAAYLFAEKGYGIDVNHDSEDISGAKGAYVVESFIARPGDPDFIEGSWVLGMRIADDKIWQAVLEGEINGYSYEALVSFLPAQFAMVDDGVRTGRTEPAASDGHTHEFMVLVDESNRVIEGGTSDAIGMIVRDDVTVGQLGQSGGLKQPEQAQHSHPISKAAVTDHFGGHSHRLNIVSGKGGK